MERARMKTITYKGNKYKLFSEEQHIKKHTKKENTYCHECLFCEFPKFEARKIFEEVK
jgi:hypothetical protein